MAVETQFVFKIEFNRMGYKHAGPIFITSLYRRLRLFFSWI